MVGDPLDDFTASWSARRVVLDAARNRGLWDVQPVRLEQRASVRQHRLAQVGGRRRFVASRDSLYVFIRDAAFQIRNQQQMHDSLVVVRRLWLERWMARREGRQFNALVP